jgi:hypothetical protein
MIPGHPRTAGDRPRQPAARRFAPEQLHGNGITIRALLIVLLSGLAVVAALHLYARFA